jgi:hypothetical protein
MEEATVTLDDAFSAARNVTSMAPIGGHQPSYDELVVCSLLLGMNSLTARLDVVVRGESVLQEVSSGVTAHDPPVHTKSEMSSIFFTCSCIVVSVNRKPN